MATATETAAAADVLVRQYLDRVEAAGELKPGSAAALASGLWANHRRGAASPEAVAELVEERLPHWLGVGSAEGGHRNFAWTGPASAVGRIVRRYAPELGGVARADRLAAEWSGTLPASPPAIAREVAVRVAALLAERASA